MSPTSSTRTANDVSTVDIADRVYDMYALVDRGHALSTVDFCHSSFMMRAPGLDADLATYRQLMTAREQATYTTRHLVHNLRIVERSADFVGVDYNVTVHRLDAGAAQPTVTVVDLSDRWMLDAGNLVVTDRVIDLVFDSRPAQQAEG